MSDNIDIESLVNQLSENPSDWFARNALVKYYSNLGKLEEANQALVTAVDFPTAGEQLPLAAECYRILDPEYGLDILNTVVEQDPQNTEALLQKAKTLHKLGNEDESRNLYINTIKINKNLIDQEFEKELKLQTPPPPQQQDRGNQPSTEASKPNTEKKVPPPPPGFSPKQPTVNQPQPASEVSNISDQSHNQRDLAPISSFNLDEFYYPEPGGFPTASATSLVKIAPLVDPDSLPELHELEYNREARSRETVYTSREELDDNLRNVYVQVHDESVVMDYEHPENVLPERHPEAIQIVAKKDAMGRDVAPQPLAYMDPVERENMEKERKKQGRNKALIIAVLLHGVVALILLGIKMAMPEEKQPTITAIMPTVEVTEIEQDILEEVQTKPSETLPAPDIISTNTETDFAMVSMEGSDSFDPVINIPSTSLSSLTQASKKQNVLFNVEIDGKLGVIFDVSVSTQKYLPKVIKEISRGFQDAPIVCIRSAAISRDETPRVVPFSRADKNNSAVMDYWSNKNAYQKGLFEKVKELLNKWPEAYVDSKDSYPDMTLGIKYLMRKGINNIYIFSDFRGKPDVKLIERLTRKLANKQIKMYFHVLGEKISNDETDDEAAEAYKAMVAKTGGQIFFQKHESGGGKWKDNNRNNNNQNND